LIYVKVTVKGEPDTSPFTRVFSYPKEIDEEIFMNTITMIKERLDRNLKINTNEALIVYSSYILSELREEKPIEQIQKNASKILSPQHVLIGVPETLRKMSFEVKIDNKLALVVLDTPIPVSEYVLKST
jgi:urease gamma subunit